MCALVHRSLRCNPMPPRITEESYRPRVSDRTMCYRLFKADNRHPACQFQKPNGVVATKTWNHSGKEKKVSRLERETTHSTDRVCTFKSWAECRDQKSVGIEPTGEIVLLTFTLIGPSELVSAVVPAGVDPGGGIARIQSWQLLSESRLRVGIRPTDGSSIVSNSCSPKTPGAFERRSFEGYCRLPIRPPTAQ
jgi:hypothetical protein